MLTKIIKELKKPFNLFLISILLLAFFIRIYRIDQLLGFYYDQGRDALVIWDLWHNGKLFLIGPTTGIAGIFRGPWYYWLIAPFYLIGQGNPIYPSIFLALTTVVAMFFSYKIGEKVGGKISGVLALIIGSFSFYLVNASRWLSNPTPMLLISVLVIYSLFMILEGKKIFWFLLSFVLGMAMQFGSASEIFYFPAVLFIVFWKKLFPDKKTLFFSILIFGITFLPQIVFDVKHNGILSNNIQEFLFEEGSFKASFWEMVKIRLPFYFDVFSSKLFPIHRSYAVVFSYIFALLLLIQRKTLFKNPRFVIIFSFFVSPMVGMLFFQGNSGNVYDYYFTGYYLIFILLFSIVFGSFWKRSWGKIIIALFLIFFLKDNLPSVKNYVVSWVDGPTTIALGNQMQAVDWIYKDAGEKRFNVDAYVPPVIPYSYDYLFKWRGTQKYNKVPDVNQIELLYTLYEADPLHQDRLDAWLARQKGIGTIVEEVKFGGITVQRRMRIINKK